MSDQGTPSQWKLDAVWKMGRDDALLGFPCHSPCLDEELTAEYCKGYESVAAVTPEGIIWGRQARSQEGETKT